MPIVNGKYKNPGWLNNQQPPINAQNLNDISDTLEKLDAEGVGVSSFNGRTGAVTPQAGDYTAAQVGARPDTWMPTAAEVGAVPTSTTVNGKALNGNIALSASDIGITAGTTDLTPGVSNLATGTIYLVYI